MPEVFTCNIVSGLVPTEVASTRRIIMYTQRLQYLFLFLDIIYPYLHTASKTILHPPVQTTPLHMDPRSIHLRMVGLPGPYTLG